MKFNLNPKVRGVLYAITSLGTILVGYLLQKKLIGMPEVELWGGVVIAVSGMAGFNINKE